MSRTLENIEHIVGMGAMKVWLAITFCLDANGMIIPDKEVNLIS